MLHCFFLHVHLQHLQQALEEATPLLDILNSQGPQLVALSPVEGASKLDDIITKDNKKVSSIADQIQKRVDKVKLKRQKSKEVLLLLCNKLILKY